MMRTKSFVICAVVGALLTPGVVIHGQEADLRSILVSEDDLRPLVDLDTPEPQTIIAPKAESATPAVKAPGATNDATSAADRPITSVLKRNTTRSESASAPSASAPSSSSKRDVLAQPEPVTTPAPLVESSPIPPMPRPMVGSAVQVASSDPLFDFGISLAPNRREAMVRGVFVNSPAQRAGVKPGDTIVAINGQRVAGSAVAPSMLASAMQNRFFVTVRDTAGRTRTLGTSRVAASSPLTPAAAPRTTVATPTPAIRRQVRAVPVSAQQTQSVNNTASQTVANSATTAASPPKPATPQPATVASRAAQPSQGPRPQAVNAQQTFRVTPPSTPQATAVRRRPLVGDGGRIIGNGRLINSARRLFGR